MLIAELKNDSGKIVGVLMVEPKTFKTGSRGHYGNARLTIEGRKFQTSVQLVEIGSKASAGEDPTPGAEAGAES